MVGRWPLSIPLLALLLIFTTQTSADCQHDHLLPAKENYVPSGHCPDPAKPFCHIECQVAERKRRHKDDEHHFNCTLVTCTKGAIGYPDSNHCERRKCNELLQKNATDMNEYECKYGIECHCQGNECSAESTLWYIAARADSSILQRKDTNLYRYSIYDGFTNLEGPEKFALGKNGSKSTNFNPRIRVKRELFDHLLKMTLALCCLYIGVYFLYRPLNKLIEKGTGKKKRSAPRARLFSKENAGSIEDEKIEEYLKDESMLFTWYHPQQLLTPLACFPKGFPIEQPAIAVTEEKPVRCNQSKEYLTMAA